MIFSRAVTQVVKSDQEQAVASWINYLNQVRLDKLMAALNAQDINLGKALGTINKTVDIIDKNIIERNRGGLKGMHGFIAEVAECGIGNAREEIHGKMPVYEWINDNGPADLARNGVQIQQKFVASGGHLSLQAIRQHFSNYPWFLKNGGKYQIPEDHYEQIKKLLSISERQANKMPTSTGEFSLKQWKEVHDFFDKGDIKFEDIEPSKLDYKDVQAAQIHTTLKNEKSLLRETDKEIRKEAYDVSKPTVGQAVQITVVSAAIEGGTAFISAIIKKRRAGKQIRNFTQSDWDEILKESGLGTIKGGLRGVSIYTLTNFTATPAAVASSLCTASFGIAQQTYLFKTGAIDKEQFIMNSEILCLDCSVSALSSFIGQALIPLPVLGAVIGNSVGTTLYQVAKEGLSKKEQQIITGYLQELEELDNHLDRKYRIYIDELNSALSRYYRILAKAFSPNYEEALNGSIELATYVGVPTQEILKNKNEIDHYFL